MMSAKVKKFNKYQIGQGRNFVITNTQLYNFNVKSKSLNLSQQYCYVLNSQTNVCDNTHIFTLELRRTIGIENLIGVTKNMQKGSKEFVIHVDHEPDYRLTCEQ